MHIRAGPRGGTGDRVPHRPGVVHVGDRGGGGEGRGGRREARARAHGSITSRARRIFTPRNVRRNVQKRRQGSKGKRPRGGVQRPATAQVTEHHPAAPPDHAPARRRVQGGRRGERPRKVRSRRRGRAPLPLPPSPARRRRRRRCRRPPARHGGQRGASRARGGSPTRVRVVRRRNQGTPEDALVARADLIEILAQVHPPVAPSRGGRVRQRRRVRFRRVRGGRRVRHGRFI